MSSYLVKFREILGIMGWCLRQVSVQISAFQDSVVRINLRFWRLGKGQCSNEFLHLAPL